MISNKPLRILVVVNLPWDSRLGAVRVWMELAEQWRAAGHVVEKYSLSDAFPIPHSSSATFSLRQVFFAWKAAAFVRKNGARFHIIDALIGVLPFSKKRLGFHGLLVVRSVGLYRLYDRFDQSVKRRWPRPAQGKFLGKIFYALVRRRLLHASDLAIERADLINLPNEEEAACLRQEVRADLPIVVEPYGLTVERRRALLQGAAPAEIRLPQKKICFIGMWGARKGAHDWSQIIERVRQRFPEAQFRFLGTMIEPAAILSDLKTTAPEGIELISDYQPDDLPELLADCTVGAFPSYAEGFGLAVLEQLAAGIPTIAYDTAGPRDLLGRHLPELLVPIGDIDGFAAAICRVLALNLVDYKKLSECSAEAASEFSWPVIAQSTLEVYRRALARGFGEKILFVQPFSLGSAGGGARILRALLEQAPFAWQSICTSPERHQAWPNELHLPSRPAWGRIEHSRFAAFPNISASFFAPLFRKRMKDLFVRLGARAIHAVPHAGLDFAHVHAVARELGLPFLISLHDDLAYTAAKTVAPQKRESAMREAWRDSAARFVISEELGREYSARYGARDYAVVTDGLTQIAAPRAARDSSTLRIYFMGLFHMGYERNLRALLDGLALFERKHPSITIDMRCRCEHIRPHVLAGAKSIAVLPFAKEAEVRRDMETADLLYMPIPFGKAHENFARYSLSTKMVTYSGSGVPILYHGPAQSAAHDLLQKNNAAFLLTSLVPEEIAQTLAGLTAQKREQIASNALALASREFMLADQTRKFWSAFSRCFSAV
ncbi:MAG TPA: glycosyltransferase [Chthoniobacterales bacterium]|jgi:glycosyltransferase involved in cell wall biosynthesis